MPLVRIPTIPLISRDDDQWSGGISLYSYHPIEILCTICIIGVLCCMSLLCQQATPPCSEGETVMHGVRVHFCIHNIICERRSECSWSYILKKIAMRFYAYGL